ncbi:MAG: hypothetical protein GY884_14265, partial [Proteobacteria bacterium]|nr:hypothetical protein [Pseudomonadota bacterium]
MLLFALACLHDEPCSDGFGRLPSGECVELGSETTEPSSEVDEPEPEPSDGEPESQDLAPEVGVDAELVLALTASEFMPTAITAAWAGPDDSWLEIDGRDERFGEGRTEVVLLAPQDREFVVRAVSEVDGERIESEPVMARTGSFDVPLELPVEQLADDASMTDQLVMLAYEADGERRVVLATGEGELLWQLDEQLGSSATVSAQVALDGRGLFVGQWASHAPTLTTERM